MRLTREEEDLVILLAEAYEARASGVDGWVHCDQAQKSLGIDETSLKKVIHNLCNRGLFEVALDETKVLPKPACVSLAREIQAARAAAARSPDRVAGFIAWARANRWAARLIIGFVLVSAVVGLAASILGIVAFVRSCTAAG